MHIKGDRSKRVGAGLVVFGVLLFTSGMTFAVSAAEGDKVVLCHYDGQSGKFQTLEVAPTAAQRHIADHDNDHPGPCAGDTTSTTVLATTSTTVLATTSTTVLATTSTTVPATTSTTVPATTSTTVPATTSTTVPATTTSSAATSSSTTILGTPTTILETPTTTAPAPTTTTTVLQSTTTSLSVGATTVASTPTTTSTTAPAIAAVAEETTTTLAFGSTTSPSVASGGSNDDDDAPANPSPAMLTDTISTTVDVLPFTGVSLFLIGPGLALIVAGVFTVALSNALTAVAAASHASWNTSRVRLRRGRHQR